MSLKVNNTDISEIKYNNTDLEYLLADGVEVWSKYGEPIVKYNGDIQKIPQTVLSIWQSVALDVEPVDRLYSDKTYVVVTDHDGGTYHEFKPVFVVETVNDPPSYYWVIGNVGMIASHDDIYPDTGDPFFIMFDSEGSDESASIDTSVTSLGLIPASDYPDGYCANWGVYLKRGQ